MVVIAIRPEKETEERVLKLMKDKELSKTKTVKLAIDLLYHKTYCSTNNNKPRFCPQCGLELEKIKTK